MWALLGWRPARLARGTLAMVSGMGGRALVQGVVFLVVARVLGIEGYGAYAATLALGMGLGFFAGLGGQHLLVRDISTARCGPAVAWSAAVTRLVLTWPPVLLTYFGLALWVLPDSIPVLAWALIGFAELVFAPLSRLATAVFQAQEQLGRAAGLVFLPVTPRLVAAMALMGIDFTSSFGDSRLLTIWALLHTSAAVVAAGLASVLVLKRWGAPFFYWRWPLREGFPFSLNDAANKLFADLDKIMLARLSALEGAGGYSAGYRLVELAFVPVQALAYSAMPRHWREGGSLRSPLGAVSLALSTTYGLLIAVGMVLLRPVLTTILGPSFAALAEMLAWLAVLPPIMAIRKILQQLALAGGFALQVMRGMLVATAVNVALNSVAIPIWGWKGALAVTLICEVGIVLRLFVVFRREAE